MKSHKLGRRPLDSSTDITRKYWIFAPEFREMNKYERDRKVANLASNDGKCWWVKEWLTMYPNRVSEASRKNHEK